MPRNCNWSKNEMWVLSNFYPKMLVEDFEHLLPGRTTKAIKERAKRLGLVRDTTEIRKNRKLARRSLTTQRRFWGKVKIGDLDECWEWQGTITTAGYGRFFLARQRISAHRASWELTYGPIPHDGSYHGVCVCHHCDNPPCVNPLHLFLGTHLDNMTDMAEKGRYATGGDARPASVLTIDQVREIKAILRGRARSSLRDIARQYNVSHSTIWMIDREKLWKEVKI